MKILIVDDDHAIVSLWSLALEQEGYHVVTAFNAKEGLEKAKSETPGLMLLDQIMPDMKGNDLLRILKDDPTTRDIPVYILSNYNDDTMMHDAIERGAVEYLLKYQIAPGDLVTKIQSIAPSTRED